MFGHICFFLTHLKQLVFLFLFEQRSKVVVQSSVQSVFVPYLVVCWRHGNNPHVSLSLSPLFLFPFIYLFLSLHPFLPFFCLLCRYLSLSLFLSTSFFPCFFHFSLLLSSFSLSPFSLLFYLSLLLSSFSILLLLVFPSLFSFSSIPPYLQPSLSFNLSPPSSFSLFSSSPLYLLVSFSSFSSRSPLFLSLSPFPHLPLSFSSISRPLFPSPSLIFLFSL